MAVVGERTGIFTKLRELVDKGMPVGAGSCLRRGQGGLRWIVG